MASRWASAAAAFLAALAIAPATASADGDPASDVLLGENVFYPYSPPTSAALHKTLDAATATAKRNGFPLKVALIASPVDLGVIPDLFGKPQKYADFLDQEISFRAKQPLLVVMPAGYGSQGVSSRASAALSGLPKPAGKTGDDLARAAVAAVTKLASADGHPITTAGSGAGTTTVIVAILASAAATAAAALVVLRRRDAARRRAPGRGSAPPSG